jgi:type II secretion system protein H
MTHGVQPQAGAAAGFTLLELLVVLAILALAAAIALPTLTSPSDGVRLRSAAGEIAAALRAARAAAIARNGEVAVMIDADRRSLEVEGLPARRFSVDIAARLTVAEPERAAPTAPRRAATLCFAWAIGGCACAWTG